MNFQIKNLRVKLVVLNDPQPWTKILQLFILFLKKIGECIQVLHLLVGEAFWDLIGGKNTYEEIQESFKKIGTKYWEKLSAKF